MRKSSYLVFESICLRSDLIAFVLVALHLRLLELHLPQASETSANIDLRLLDFSKLLKLHSRRVFASS